MELKIRSARYCWSPLALWCLSGWHRMMAFLYDFFTHASLIISSPRGTSTQPLSAHNTEDNDDKRERTSLNLPCSVRAHWSKIPDKFAWESSLDCRLLDSSVAFCCANSRAARTFAASASCRMRTSSSRGGGAVSTDGFVVVFVGFVM